MKTKPILPEKCDCGRLYKDRIDENGKMVCSACYNKCEVDDMKKVWSKPIPKDIQNIFGKD